MNTQSINSLLNTSTERRLNFHVGKNGPFSTSHESQTHQYFKAGAATVADACVVRSKAQKHNTKQKLHGLIAKWLDEHQWIASRARSAAAHLTLRWRDLSQEQKHRRAFEYAEATGAHAFSLDLSEMVAKRAAAAHDPARYLAKRLNGKLSKQGPNDLEYAFILDVAKTGKLHVHGIFLLGQDDIKLVESALRQAGGKFSKETIARQLSVSELYAGLGFLRYCMKARKQTTMTLAGGRFEFVNQTLNRAAEAFHEANRPEKWRAQRGHLAPANTKGLVESIGESLARMGLPGQLMLSCAINALLRPSQALPHDTITPRCRSERRRNWPRLPHRRFRSRIKRSATGDGWQQTSSHLMSAQANRRLRNIGAVCASQPYQDTLHLSQFSVKTCSGWPMICRAGSV